MRFLFFPAENEFLSTKIKHKQGDAPYVEDFAARDISVAELFDVPSNDTRETLQNAAERPRFHKSSNRIVQPSVSDDDDESGDDDDDDEDEKDEVDDIDDNDDHDHDFEKNEFRIIDLSQHHDSDDDEENDKGKERDDDDGHKGQSLIANHRTQSFPLPQKEKAGGNHLIQAVPIMLKSLKLQQTKRKLKLPIPLLSNLSKTESEIRLEENRPNLMVEIVNTQQNQGNRSFQSSERTSNLSHLNATTWSQAGKSAHHTLKKHGSHLLSRFPHAKPISPPVGLSSRPLVSATSLLFGVFNDTLDSLKHFSNASVCPLLRIRQSQKPSENVSCILRNRELSLNSCIRASKEYELDSKPLKCAAGESEEQLCSFRATNLSGNQGKQFVACNTSQCGTNPVYVLEFSPIFGILEEGPLWKRFFTSHGLENYLKRYTNATSSSGFNFCLLLCVRKERTGFIEQLMTFPFVHKSFEESLNEETNPINLNILVLDSVSRPHFYRSLPETVKSLRDIVQFSSYSATVLDFELLQSSAAYTFHNIRGLMSGKMDFRYSGGHENETYGIDVLFGKFKELGYYTLLQEDSCWYDSWGSIFTDNAYQGNVPRDKYEFAKRWKKFQDKVKNYQIDDFGLSHASCEIFKRHKMTNQFNHPRKVCFDGKPFAEYFLDYAQSIYNNLKEGGKKTRLLTYTHLNTGHEVTGTRIRQIDERLSTYVENMARMEDTLTVILSDHGPKTTKYSFNTMEGRAEKYDPFLFIIVPEKVVHTLGFNKFRALVQNQNRLITTLDLHNGFMSLGAKGLTRTTTGSNGIFSLIPANRTCADISMKPLAVCKCKKWEEIFPDNDKRFTWLAEFALGNINNKIQLQFLGSTKQVKGYGNCQRLVGISFTKIRRRSERGNFITTMDIAVSPGNEIFEVQIKHPQRLKKQDSFLKLAVHERITIYRHFRKCADDAVSLGLCVCDHKKLQKQHTKRKQRKWIKITTREDILEIISRSNSFGSQTRVKDIHSGCLLLLYRNHGGRSTSFEISNTCDDRTYSVTISVTNFNAKKHFISRKIPFSINVPQRTIHFLLVIKRFERFSRRLRLKVKHLIKYLNQ